MYFITYDFIFTVSKILLEVASNFDHTFLGLELTVIFLMNENVIEFWMSCFVRQICTTETTEMSGIFDRYDLYGQISAHKLIN